MKWYLLAIMKIHNAQVTRRERGYLSDPTLEEFLGPRPTRSWNKQAKDIV
jgi:hypothetical protein